MKSGVKNISFSSIFLCVLFALCFLATLLQNILNIDPNLVSLYERFQNASFAHFMGTDELGRDVFIRLLQAGKVSLIVGLCAAVGSSIIGTLIGLWAAVSPRMDSFLMRLTDFIVGLPLLPFLIVVAALDFTKIHSIFATQNENLSLIKMILIISFFGWPLVARLVRAEAGRILQMDFIKASTAMGANQSRILIRHVLPNLQSTIIVATTMSIGNIILLESVLSFLGLGVQPPHPSWGNMLTAAQDFIWEAPMIAFYPGFMIFITVIAFNFLGDSLQKKYNPRLQDA